MKGETDRNFLHARIAVVLLALCMVWMGCSVRTFDGSIIFEDDGFRWEYSAFRQREEAVIPLAAGDSLWVSVIQTSGWVDIIVGIDGTEPIYEGNGITEMEFSLYISESGSYRITVTGHNASGSVAFQRITES